MGSGTELDDLRAALARVYDRLDDEDLTDAEIAELTARANELQDRIDAALEVIGAEVLRTRPRPDPPAEPSPGRLF